ncbi:MAG: DNA-binding HxlR family transcriptional regulator [Halobacteriales archaeon]|jgi:DNA-binding HxlR family transcriptional regulator
MASTQHQSPPVPVQKGDRIGNTEQSRQVDTSETTKRVVSVTDAESNDLLDLLSDQYTARILEALSVEPRPARELASICDMSRPTVYRRLDRLQEHGLASTDEDLDPDGHHRKVFATSLERVTVELVDNDPTVHLVLHDSNRENGPSPTSV